MKVQHISAAAVLSIVATVSGIWSTGAWDKVGWMTPSAHAADYEQTVEQIKDFRDEWKCDEYDEELFELKLLLKELEENGEDTTEVEHMIDKLENKIEKLDCQRFDDFG